MMPLEKQVCSLELAKRLKELGVKQDSYFFYEYYSDSAYRLSQPYDRTPQGRPFSNIEIAAFTVAELGEMLPDCIKSCRFTDGNFVFEKENNLKKGFGIYEIYKDSEADARAKMLIYLIENGLIDKDANHEKISQ